MFEIDDKFEWFVKIKQKTTHTIRHETSFRAARLILENKIISGAEGSTSIEGFPHFFYDKWPRPIGAEAREICLSFEVTRPARLRSDGGIPEPNYLEVWETGLGKPWQCVLHPVGPGLTFTGSAPDWRELEKRSPPKLSRGAWTKAGRDWRRLIKQLQLSETERRIISPALR